MADVQRSPSKKQSAGDLGNFLACGGTPKRASKPKASAILTAVDDVNIDALVTAAKNDRLPISRSKSASKAVKSLSQSAHSKPVTERRLSDIRKKGIARAQSFDKNTVMKRLGSSSSADDDILGGDESTPKPSADKTEKEKPEKIEKTEKPKKNPSTIKRSKSCEAEVAHLARIPRNIARGTADRDREPPARAKSMNDKQIAKRLEKKDHASSPKAKKDHAPVTKKSPSNLEKESKEKVTKKSSSNHDKEDKDNPKRRSRSSKPETNKKTSKSKSPTPKQSPKQPKNDTESTKPAATNASENFVAATRNHSIAPFGATFGEPSHSDSESDYDAEQMQGSGIMQFDPTAADNVVIVREDSGVAFPSCPVEMDLPSYSDLNYNNNAEQNQHPQGQDDADNDKGASKWGTFGGMKMFGGKSKLKKSNSFKFSKRADDKNADEDSEPPTSLFSTLFSSGNQHAGMTQLDDETTDGSYLQDT